MIARLAAAAAAVVGAFALASGAGARPAATAPVASAQGSAQLLECRHGKRAADRRALFRGEMARIDGAARMTMRIHLFERVGASPWRRTWAPGINLPREARPGVLRFAYRQRVLGMRRGVAYRVEIVFRWYSAEGQEIARTSARSPVCRQPGKLANLRVRSPLQVGDGPTADTRSYRVRIVNSGARGARDVAVALFVDGAEVDTVAIPRLAPRGSRTLTFVGPACSEDVVVRVDPLDTVPETTERDNSLRVPCALLTDG